MKNRICFALGMLWIFCIPDLSGQEYLHMAYEDIEKIIITDHQETGHLARYGSVYEVQRDSGIFTLYRLKQHFSMDTAETFKNVDLVNSNERVRLKELSARTIGALIRAINDTGAYDPQIISFAGKGNTTSLKGFIRREIMEDTATFEPGDAAGCMAYLDTIHDPEKILRAYYNQKRWSGDNPIVRLDLITAMDTVVIWSHQQEEYMLPWKMGELGVSYNPAISRAIAAIMPDLDYSNNDRLAGANFQREISHFFWGKYCMPLLAYQEKMSKYRPFLGALYTDNESLFLRNTDEIDISRSHLELTLSLDNVPSNILVEAHFTVGKDTLHGAVETVRVLDDVKKRLALDNWLFEWVANHPEVKGYAVLTNGVTFSPRARKFFLRETKRFAYNEDLIRYFDEVLLFEVRENINRYSRWLVFPDGRTVLWHYRGEGVLDFEEGRIPVKKIQANNLKTVSRFVDAEGVK